MCECGIQQQFLKASVCKEKHKTGCPIQKNGPPPLGPPGASEFDAVLSIPSFFYIHRPNVVVVGEISKPGHLIAPNRENPCICATTYVLVWENRHLPQSDRGAIKVLPRTRPPCAGSRVTQTRVSEDLTTSTTTSKTWILGILSYATARRFVVGTSRYWTLPPYTIFRGSTCLRDRNKKWIQTENVCAVTGWFTICSDCRTHPPPPSIG